MKETCLVLLAPLRLSFNSGTTAEYTKAVRTVLQTASCQSASQMCDDKPPFHACLGERT